MKLDTKGLLTLDSMAGDEDRLVYVNSSGKFMSLPGSGDDGFAGRPCVNLLPWN